MANKKHLTILEQELETQNWERNGVILIWVFFFGTFSPVFFIWAILIEVENLSIASFIVVETFSSAFFIAGFLIGTGIIIGAHCWKANLSRADLRKNNAGIRPASTKRIILIVFLFGFSISLLNLTLINAPLYLSRSPNPSTEIYYFPWPPPNPSASANIPNKYLLRAETESKIRDVAQNLEATLNECQYNTLKWYFAPHGFALVTKIEQIHDDGRPFPESDRWNAALRNIDLDDFSLKEYIKALFYARPGRYRVIVFVVTSEPFGYSSEITSRNTVISWHKGGAEWLPDDVALEEYTDKHRCIALIYEFRQKTRNHPAIFVEQSEIQGRVHLERSHLWEILEKRYAKK